MASQISPEFVRDIMGSSMGDWSEDFHVYCHIRRHEYVQQDYLDHQTEKAIKDQDFQESLRRIVREASSAWHVNVRSEPS